ncbi:LysM peptidoglycan-binding domain-containing protein, partial [Candidatus Saccharibacteria bacterium]|nr:LysM peptidoglycan-binding domain-containing protein [Candidatus Saccharibacteria bacterium]
VRWSNGLRDDTVSVGQVLLIPSVDGFVYTVRAGDTVDGLAGRYQTSAETILIYNDLEVTGLQEGMKIIIPDGILPESERPEYVPPVSYNPPIINVPGGSFGEVLRVYRNPYPFVDNSYAWGWCTWYAAVRRAEMGNPIGRNWGNASAWAYSAARAGFGVGGTPQVGAIMANGGGFGGWGHVAIVEEVNHEEGWIIISEMNGVGGGLWLVSWRRIPMSTALNGTFRYIY